MKAIVLITFILTTIASLCIAAETRMTIQTNTTIRIDPITGDIKGGAHTEVRGIKIDPPPTTTSSTGISSTDQTTASVTGTSSTDSAPTCPLTTGVSTASPAPAITSDSGTSPTDTSLTPSPVTVLPSN